MAADAPAPVADRSPVLGRARDLLRVATLLAPSRLIPVRTRDEIVSLAPLLPRAFSIAAFEVPLEPGRRRVDFEICIQAGEREALAAWLDGPVLAQLAASDASWARTRTLLRRWRDPGSPLYDGVEVVWLEFDLEPGRPARPFVVLTLRRDGEERTPARDRREAGVLGAGLDILSDGLDPDVAGRVRRCVAAIQASGRLRHVAVRPVPGGDTVRLVAQVPRHRVSVLLRRIGWPGDRTPLADLLERLGPATTTQAVNLDVWRSVGPRVGAEFHFPTSPVADERWQTLFDGLVRAGACTPAKRDALGRWRPPDGEAHFPLERELLVKVVHERGRPLRAKAYLPFAWSASLCGP